MDENSFPHQDKSLKQRLLTNIEYVVRYAFGSVAKHQARRKPETISDNANFKVYGENQKNKNHKYNKVFGFVDCGNSDKLARKSCKGTFLKDFYLNLQPPIPSTLKETRAELAAFSL